MKIEALELPSHYEAGEGEYEIRWGNNPKEPEYHDLFSLERLLKEVWPDRCQDILDRLQNFKKAFLNLESGEIQS